MALAISTGMGNWAEAATIGALAGQTAAQSALRSPQGRFSTDDMDATLLAALAGGSTGSLYATGTGIDVRYVGTDAARGATLRFDGQALFDTRIGCDYATALVDEFCLIDSIGLTRRIDGLTAGSAVNFTLDALPQPLGDASVMRPDAQTFTSLTGARWLDIGGGQFVLGFEEGSDSNFLDMVFVLSGLTASVPVSSAVHEPASAGLLLGGLLLGGRLLARLRPRA